MTIFTGIIVYLLIWWLSLFTVLPWGNNAAQDSQIGHVSSAPFKPRIKKKFLITTILSAFIWGGLYAIIESNIFNPREVAFQMIEEDRNKK